jgi:predicted RNA-binding Zn-ribbon protein involved in translation (DUF1610 family)
MVDVELALQALVAVKGLATTAFNAKVDHEVKSAQIEIQSKLLDVQQHLVSAVDERLSLLRELDEAKRQVRTLEDAKGRLDAYELVHLQGEALLYRARDHAVAHYACPACYDGGKVSVLQSQRTGAQQTLYRCSVCNFACYVGPEDPRPTEPDGLNWMAR